MSDDPYEESETRFLIQRWRNGDSVLPAVRRMIDGGHGEAAAALARVALADEACRDRDQLEAALVEIASPPDDWMQLLAGFAREPGVERWQAMMRFVPEEFLYQRIRAATTILSELGCDGDELFRCVSSSGMTPDLFELAKSGRVHPETIEARGSGSPARPAWLSIAAIAAFARGDHFNTVRYFKEACANEATAFYAWAAISEVRRDASDELNAELDRAGVPDV
jgi:hypothetical protein